MPAGTSDTRSKKVGSDVSKPYCGDSTFSVLHASDAAVHWSIPASFAILVVHQVYSHTWGSWLVLQVPKYLLPEYYHQLCQLLLNNAHPDIFVLHLMCIKSGFGTHAKLSNRFCIALQRDHFHGTLCFDHLFLARILDFSREP